MPLHNNYNNALHSEVIHHIIGQIPPWVVRWGITVIFLVFVIIIFCSYYIRYPDLLPAKVMITTNQQPFKVSWYISGPHTHRVYVQQGARVKPGDTLIVEKDLLTGTLSPIISPVGGYVTQMKGGADNPRKSTLIVCPRLEEFEVQLNIQPKGSGMVKPGQHVLIKLEAYPSETYGLLEARIVSIIPVPFEGLYRAKVNLAREFTTTKNIRIPPQHFMTGSAEIMLENKSLFHHVFGSIFSSR